MELAKKEEGLHEQLNRMAHSLSNPAVTELKSICEFILTNWAHGQSVSADSKLDFEIEMKQTNEEIVSLIKNLEPPGEAVINEAVRNLFIKQVFINYTV